jgi:hypothetical protein
MATLEKGIPELGLTTGNGSTSPISVSFPLPRAPQTNVHVQLHDNGPNILLFLATSTPESSTVAPLGSLVYAMPNVSFLASNTSPVHMLTNVAENESLRSAEHTAIHTSEHARFYNKDGESSDTAAEEASVCGKFDKLCQCGDGWGG